MNYLLVMAKSAAKSSGGYNVFPVGIAYVSASLKKCKKNVFTSNLEFSKETTYNALHNLIVENNIDVVATSGLSRDYPKIKEIIDLSRKIKKDIITVVGGGIVSSDPYPAMLALGADIGIVGQGEITICELADALESDADYSEITGLIYKNEKNDYTLNSPREEIDNIDTIPMPDYDGFNFAEYMSSTNYEAAFVVGSRSCPFQCTFCFHPSGNKYRQRSLENLFIEIDYQAKTYNVRKIAVCDELFAIQRDRVIEFCERITPYNIKWSVQLRVSDIDVELLELMREAGCEAISYGIESANNSILKSMKKRITVEEIEHALKITHAANIEIQGGLIFGDIAESNTTVENSLKWNSVHQEYTLELNMIHIFPGTPVYNYAVEKGIIKDKVQFLKDGCPLINISTLTDDEYRDLSSLLYEKNMRSKYLPKNYYIKKYDQNQSCLIEMKCNKCNKTFTLETDNLHIKRVKCPSCNQRHYVDPFLKLNHSQEMVSNYFADDELIAVWGAGEICIKLLDNYNVFQNDNFKIVDISKSRQGYTVGKKLINSPDIIDENKISKVIIAIVHRKDEVFEQIKNQFPTVTSIYVPDTEIINDNISFVLKEVVI